MCILLSDAPHGENEKTFTVRPNLHSALRTFRMENSPRTLWIDAICINQADLVEKSAQISLMRQIFEEGLRTLIWLGQETQITRTSIGVVRKLKAAWDHCTADIPTIAALTCEDLARFGLPKARPLYRRGYHSDPDDYEMLLRMLNLPWFDRAWVVQEVTVSKCARLCWGSESIDWQDLITAIFFALRVEIPFASQVAAQRIVAIADENTFYESGGSKLLPVLLRHRSCKATNPLDKIYAFMGLTERSLRRSHPIHVDYNQNLATAFTNVAKELARQDRSLDILSLPPTPFTSTLPTLPTWAPDWSVSPDTRSRYGTGRYRNEFRCESVSLANTE